MIFSKYFLWESEKLLRLSAYIIRGSPCKNDIMLHETGTNLTKNNDRVVPSTQKQL